MMASLRHSVPLLLLMVASLCGIVILADGNCYDNWSRCTPQTAFATGILWKDCAEYCRVCKERESGECVRVFNKTCSGGYQCQCRGGHIDVKRTFLQSLTCSMKL